MLKSLMLMKKVGLPPGLRDAGNLFILLPKAGLVESLSF